MSQRLRRVLHKVSALPLRSRRLCGEVGEMEELNLTHSLHQHRFDFQKLFQAIFAEFAAIAGLFVAAKRNHRIEFAAVDFHLPGSQTARTGQS